ncbi:hypothetical protein CCR75_000706 [Bremia lactucae]|uniref:TAZ-type domain-containing protein n=1 Tax=Bremia lactucae TaxID=4779 RepID=A0A976IBA5_BRELC|nr:hypothetical protein CCR75_000706 [Bremia lactucae]
MIPLDHLCSWCRSSNWQFKCYSCDPRRVKTLCSNCSNLWHFRGFARTHLITTSNGETRSFLAWSQLNGNDIGNKNEVLETANKNNALNHRSDQGHHDIPPIALDRTMSTATLEEKESTIAAVQEDRSRQNGLTQYNGEKQLENLDPRMALEEAPRKPVEDHTIPHVTSATATVWPVTTSNTQEEASSISNATSQSLGHTGAHAVANSTNSNVVFASAKESRNPALASATLAAVTPLPPVAAVTHPNTEATPLDDLDKLLRSFPTTDRNLLELLAKQIERALKIEDALICARNGQCEDGHCRSVLRHYEHCKSNTVCKNALCITISVIYTHRQDCLFNKRNNNGFVCPFCIRIYQRRSFGVSVALNYLISVQRRVLQSVSDNTTRNFCLQSIARWTESTRSLRAAGDRLNQLARKSSLPIFNFPKYSWHLTDEIVIKQEVLPVESEKEASVEQFTMESFEYVEKKPTEPLLPYNPRDVDLGAESSQVAQVIENSKPAQEDYIKHLLVAKSKSGESSKVAEMEFDGCLEFGYAIVDASFCAPSKAQRCLLNCKVILDHLQHHLDLKVCNQPMCEAVEHHFVHLSDCNAIDQSQSCEYCLLMDERRLIRSAAYMEVEQIEAEATVQKLIHEIAASMVQHTKKHHQEMVQLENELDQAEANKEEIIEKLVTKRSELQIVRKNLATRGVATSRRHQLPVHFTKNCRSLKGPENGRKRRLADVESESSSP